MRKLVSLLLVLAMMLGVSAAFAAETTIVGTPRNETLIVEMQNPTQTAGQFSPMMQGTNMGTGIQQLLWGNLYEIDTVKGEQFPSLAAEFPKSNEDFTEHTIAIRQGIKWSDGVDFTAKDVHYTMNLMLTNPEAPSHGYYQQIFESIDLVDDYTIKIKTKESFPLLAESIGVLIWGNDLRVVPEHIYSKEENPVMFKNSNPVVTGPYTVKQFDELGNWILYELREDAIYSDVGVVTGKVPKAKYVLFQTFGDDATRTMTMVSNLVDIMVEVSPENWEVMKTNPKAAMWYPEYPYALFDDPCSKGIAFNNAKPPFSDKNFRWALALAMDFKEVSMNIFDGAGRASVLQIPATASMQELYYKPMEEWLENFELEDGYKPFNTNYAREMAEILKAQGIEVPDDDALLDDMFGIGSWKHDPEQATKLLQKAGLELKDGKWYWEGEPFKFTCNILADTEAQAGRGGQAAVDQWVKFGLDVTPVKMTHTAFTNANSLGEFDVGDYWPSCAIIRNLYRQINGWDADLIKPIGERSSGGNGERLNSPALTEKIHELARYSSQDEKSYEISTEILKIFVEELPFIGFHSGTKFVPTNNTYWTNYPTSENPYNGPWWWWSAFKYILPHIEPVQ